MDRFVKTLNASLDVDWIITAKEIKRVSMENVRTHVYCQEVVDQMLIVSHSIIDQDVNANKTTEETQ